MPQHRLAAARVELGDAVGLDVLLARQPEFLFHGDLDGQPVAVPAGLAEDVEPLHGLEPGEDVLEDPGLDVVHAGHAVRGGRPLVERPPGGALGLLQRRLERPFRFHRASSSCSIAGRSGCAGSAGIGPPGARPVLRRPRVRRPRGGRGSIRVRHSVFLQRQRISSARGTRHVSAAPRYHPLCPPANPTSRSARLAPANRRRPSSRTRSDLLSLISPVLLSHRPAASRARNPGRRRPFFRPLRGDLVHGARPRARTVPGSLRAAFRGSCPLQRSS